MAYSGKAFSEHTVANSLNEFETPKKAYIATKVKKEIHTILLKDQTKAFHIHGIPGCGKSQIVAAICQESANKGYIVWQVQCQPYGGNIVKGWKKLCDRLVRAKLISQPEFEEATSALENPSTQTIKQFLNIIDQIKFRTLLAVEFEDVDDITPLADDREILKLLVEEFSANQNVQVLIASRNEDIIFAATEVPEERLYTRREVRGFTEDEAKLFLRHEKIQCTEECIIALAKELAYSPLGLLMAKNYCLEFRVTYDEYFKSLGNDESITKKEKELLSRHHDLGKNHRYEIMMKLLKPSNDAEMIDFRVLKMMSFLNKNNIPVRILESFFKHIEYKNPDEIKILTNHLIRKLEKRVKCKRKENGPISVHGDILRVLQASMSPEEKSEMLSDVVFSLCSILDKDNRRRKDYRILYELTNHIMQVSVHCSNYFQHLANEAAATQIRTQITNTDYEILLSLSRIHELVGFVISQHAPALRVSNDEDEHFEKAMEYLWGAVTMGKDASIFKTLMMDRIRGKAMKHQKKTIIYEVDKDPRKCANEVYKLCRDKTKDNKLLCQALENDCHRNFSVKQSDLDIMKKMENKSGIPWNRLEAELYENGVLSEESQNKLIGANLILNWQTMRQFYVVERLTSILHSRGRQDNYKRDSLDDEMIKKCKWWVELGYQLCVKVAKKTGVNTLFEYILRANNQLPKLSTSRKDESDLEFQQRITEVREMALTLPNEDRIFYEHGKIRVVSNAPFPTLNARRYLIKVNTKVHRRPDLLKGYPLAKADEEANETYNLAVSNPTVVIGSECLVYVGKYYAARKNFWRALETFEKAFVLGTEDDADEDPVKFAWTLYNMLRMLVAAGELDGHTEQNIKRRYSMAKRNDGIPVVWMERLTNMLAAAPTSDLPTANDHVRDNVTNQPSDDVTQ